MNRLAWLVGSGALVVSGSIAAIAGCGSDDAAVDESNVDAAGSSSGSSGSSSGSSGMGGPEAGDAATTDATTTDATADGGGLVSTPNKIACGTTQCTAPAEACCITLNDAGCRPENQNCQGGAKAECEEKADCTGGDVCCLSIISQGAQCKNGCGGGMGGGGGNIQLCKTNAECPAAGGDAGTCYVNTCTFGGNTRVIDACSKIPMCTQ